MTLPVIEDPTSVAGGAFSALTSGLTFTVTPPNLANAEFQAPAATGPLYAAITKLTNDDLTQGVLPGTGTFDRLMAGFKAHLEGEYKANRISGAEYTKAFIALTEGAMSNAVQFLLGRDTAYWQAVTAQVQAQVAQVALVTARVELETAKQKLLQTQLEGQVAKANYALTKMRLATEAANYNATEFNFEVILPQQYALLQEQTEAARAQTLDTRTDGLTLITGNLGKQKDLLAQQITSYKRDAEVKAGKLFVDAWITQKTLDEGLVAPTGFTNASVDTVLTLIKTNNGFV